MGLGVGYDVWFGMSLDVAYDVCLDMSLDVCVCLSLGHWPVRHKPSKDPNWEAERLLALRVSKMKAEGCLPPAAVKSLQRWNLNTAAFKRNPKLSMRKAR